MKFSIKFKIVALGAVLSLLVTSSAVLFANFEYRRRGEANLMNNINNWLDNLNGEFTTATYSDEYIRTIEKTKKYILDQYEEYPDDAPEDLTTEERKLFYKTRFQRLYAIEGLGMYPMDQEELDFRDDYQEFIYLLSDAKSSTKATAVYASFITENNTMFYIGDEYSYKKITRPDMLFPGSRLYNFDGEITQDSTYYSCTFNGTRNRVLPIKNDDKVVAYIFIQYDFAAVNKDVNSLISMEIIVLSIASVIMILAYALGAHFLFLRGVSRLNKSASEFTNDLSKGKKLEEKDPKIKTRDEIHELSDSFIALEKGIITYIDVIQKETQEKERTNAELSLASNIQLGALPNHEFDDKQTSIRTFIKSAKEVGGDFYDYFYLDENRLAIIISDVSGKGVPAALFMMKSKELIKSAVRTHHHLIDAVREVNTMLTNNNSELLFVTSFVGIIDFAKGKINYVNCGHEKPYIVSSKGVRKLEGESNFVMGLEDGFEYKEESIDFNKGEYLFLFTDGLNESINEDNEEFSYEGIEKVLNESKNSLPNEVINSMSHSLEEFVGKKEQFDDVTMVVVKYQDEELHLSYDKKDYTIITDIVDKFNNRFSSIDEETRSKAGIIIDELVNNLISYEKREDLKIEVSFKVVKKELILTIRSNGEDYNPFANHKEKYYEEFHPEIKEGGFGLSIIKDLAKSYKYEYLDGHSVITIVLQIK